MNTKNAAMLSAGLLLVGAAAMVSLADTSGAPAPTPPRQAATAHLGPATATAGALTLTLALEHPLLGLASDRDVAMIELRTDPAAPAQRTPVAMALALDVSGSMAGDKLTDAREAARRLVLGLAEGDRLSLVTFASEARVDLADLVLSHDRSAALAAVDRIDVRGTTCISCGIEAARGLLAAAPRSYQRRLIVLSDGHANMGVQDAPGLSQLVGATRTEGIVTSSIGLGRSYDAATMQVLAEAGAGGFYFVHNAAVIGDVLATELASLKATVLRDLEIRLDAAPGLRLGQVGDLSAPPELPQRTVTVGPLPAGAERRLLLPLALPQGLAGHALTATARFRDLAGVQREIPVSVSVARSDDPAAIAAAASAAVTAEVGKLRSVAAIEQALEAKQAGRDGEALRIIDEARSRLQAVAAATGDGDAKADAAEMGVLRSKLESFAPGSAGMAATVRLNDARGAEVKAGKPTKSRYHSNGMYNEAELQ